MLSPKGENSDASVVCLTVHPRDILMCRFGDQELCLLIAKATELMAMTKVLSMKTKLPVACTCPPSNICLDNARLEYELQSVSKSTYCMYFLKVVKTKTNKHSVS